MYLSGRHLELRRRGRRPNPRLIFLLLALIFAALLVLSGWSRGDIQPLFVPTPPATRNPRSFAEEAEAQFSAGKLDKAINAYQQATILDPRNVDYWVALARIQIYARQYEAALTTAEQALYVAPNSARSKAVYAWTLDWNASRGCRCKTLAEAEAAALQAIALDSNYAPAHAYYSEILNDGQKWEQGSREAQLALSLDSTSLDAHRAMGYANESVGNYDGAIQHYKDALAINPNLVVIYLSLGLNYRVQQRYDEAIAAFSKASSINPYDIEPYLSLSRTYYQIDDFGAAIQYLDQAVQLSPSDPTIHGRKGLIYFKAKNYEGAEPELRLAVYGGPLVDGQGQPIKDAQGQAVTVQALPLRDDSLEYFYTLGNLMAFNYQCGPDQAPALLTQVLKFAPDNPTVVGSYEESMGICNSFMAGTLQPGAATATPEPTAIP